VTSESRAPHPLLRSPLSRWEREEAALPTSLSDRARRVGLVLPTSLSLRERVAPARSEAKRRSRVRGVALALLLFACHRPPIAAEKKPVPPARENLLTLAQGASVVSRTGELDLTHSALRAIDTTGNTGWVTPSGDPIQTAIFSLGSKTRIDHVGLVTTILGSAARDVRFDFSIDGQTFTNPVTLNAKLQDGPQLAGVTPPVEAQYIRVSILNARGAYAFIREVIVNGTFVAPPTAGTIDGCWSVNAQPATFTSDHARVHGYVGGVDDTTLEGGSNGRFYRFAWTRGKEYGLAAMSVTPDARHLASIVWHEQAIEAEQFYASDWFGERGACPAKKDADVFTTYLQRLGYFPLYALRFADDGTLDAGASAPTLARVTELLAANPPLHVTFVAHELTHATPRENLAIAQKQIVSLREALRQRGADLARVQFVAAGDEHPRRAVTSELTRAMYSSVDLELRR
jgi:F5/8 type C domain-containing protein